MVIYRCISKNDIVEELNILLIIFKKEKLYLF